MTSVRLDKWLWAVRLFKTRSQAAKACEANRVKSGEKILKPATELRGGELLELPFPEGPGNRTVRVLDLIDKRVGAPAARLACEELTPPEVVALRKIWSESRIHRQEGDQGRPTKRNRRELEKRRGFFE